MKTSYDLKFNGSIEANFYGITQGKVIYLLNEATKKAKGSLDKETMRNYLSLIGNMMNDGGHYILPFMRPNVKHEFYADITFHFNKEN